jgi:hypothetical protein
VAFNAAEHYFAEQKLNQELPTMGGLETAVRSALVEAFFQAPQIGPVSLLGG